MPTHKARPGRSGPELTNDELRRIDFLHNAVDAALRSIVQNTIGQAYEHDMAITGPVAEAIAEAISIKYGIPFDELYPSIRDDDGSPRVIEKRGAICEKCSEPAVEAFLTEMKLRCRSCGHESDIPPVITLPGKDRA